MSASVCGWMREAAGAVEWRPPVMASARAGSDAEMMDLSGFDAFLFKMG